MFVRFTTCYRSFFEKYKITDTLICHIEYDDICAVTKRDINRFDTSDYVIDNAYDILVNKKVRGLMNGAIITAFLERMKMYILRVDGKKDIKKTKCIKNNVEIRNSMIIRDVSMIQLT